MLAGMAALVILGACNKNEKTEGGVEYKIFKTSDTAQVVNKGDMLMMHVKAVVLEKDTVLFDTYSNNRPFTLPSDEPTLKDAFAKLKRGDSAEFIVIADTFYAKSIQQPLPSGIKPGDKIRFTVSVMDVYSAADIQKLQEEKMKEQTEMMKMQEEKGKGLIEKDSVSTQKFLKSMAGYKTTASGLMYKVIKAGNGKMVKSGNKVTVKYKGTLLDGTVFDETKPGQPDFTFNVGTGKVIPGWDEGLQLMKVGDSFKFVIPWKLAYGSNGGGPIPPFSTLIFDVEMLKVE